MTNEGLSMGQVMALLNLNNYGVHKLIKQGKLNPEVRGTQKRTKYIFDTQEVEYLMEEIKSDYVREKKTKGKSKTCRLCGDTFQANSIQEIHCEDCSSRGATGITLYIKKCEYCKRTHYTKNKNELYCSCCKFMMSDEIDTKKERKKINKAGSIDKILFEIKNNKVTTKELVDICIRLDISTSIQSIKEELKERGIKLIENRRNSAA